MGDEQSMATQFYTTLPNREAAEKLAALAAAGNVNSQLIGQLRKQQQERQQQLMESQQQQADQPMPPNHKEESEERQKFLPRRHKIREQEQQLRKDEVNFTLKHLILKSLFTIPCAQVSLSLSLLNS